MLRSVAPQAPRPPLGSVQAFADMIRNATNVVFLTGAGVSTESGIPDYRSPGRPPYRPLLHHEFVSSSYVRRRYWARSAFGFPRMNASQPNSVHHTLATLERVGVADHVVTQNVDSLHVKAGTQHLLELHGSLRNVHCLQCNHVQDRMAYQARLMELNSEWLRDVAREQGHFDRPDFDVELQAAQYDRFSIPCCAACGSDMVKPTVVFYGGSISKEVTEAASGVVQRCDLLCVLGSSLPVHSSARLARVAKQAGAAVAVVNIGPTRADDIADLRIHALCADVLLDASQLLGIDPHQKQELEGRVASGGRVC